MSATRILWGQIAVVFRAATQWTAWRLGYRPQLSQLWFELHATGDHAFAASPRRLVHDGRVHRIEGEHGCAVGEKVDPEDLRRQERKRDPAARLRQPHQVDQQHAEEHGHDFEDHFGGRLLLQRTTRKLTLTDDGQMLLHPARLCS
jgi:hypothetical protein